ncbi:nuclear transport factor 2 family protein [Streptomyces sp. NPDC005574]|uniref:nuclear transport factor 2 family protein n=1 Tax=Streptomyces sp. NPDC005574 TaxID=3156891 RepID=UPI0033AB21D8
MATFEGLSETEARAFTSQWLPAWTGNDPEGLAAFYANDAFYSDPAVPSGVQGRDEILSYFRRLLRKYPRWVWRNTDLRPLRDGFLNYWHAVIPTANGTVECDGVCTVTLRDGLITKNEVFFDRSPLVLTLPSDAVTK